MGFGWRTGITEHVGAVTSLGQQRKCANVGEQFAHLPSYVKSFSMGRQMEWVLGRYGLLATALLLGGCQESHEKSLPADLHRMKQLGIGLAEFEQKNGRLPDAWRQGETPSWLQAAAASLVADGRNRTVPEFSPTILFCRSDTQRQIVSDIIPVWKYTTVEPKSIIAILLTDRSYTQRWESHCPLSIENVARMIAASRGEFGIVLYRDYTVEKLPLEKLNDALAASL